MFSGHQTGKGHQLAGMGELSQVAQFGDDGGGGDRSHAAQGLQGRPQRRKRSVLHQVGDFGIKTLLALGGQIERTQVFL